MRKILSILILMCMAMIPSKAEEAGVHRFAGFNIRYANPNNGDTGDKKWSNRRQYVAKIVTDYDFDIVGMEEVTGNNKDEVTGKSQLQDLRDMLTDYADWAVEREGRNYEYNVIFYKKAKYELLDKGRFYMNSHPDSPGEGWDTGSESNLPRALGWVKLKDKTSGQEFYFAVAHINYGLYSSGIESCKLIGSRLRKIAGQMPIVLVGDFNMRRDEHETAYRGIATHLYDAALHTETTCLPSGNTTSTTSGWSSSGQGGAEFDFTFYDHMTPLSRHIITEDFGRGITPSDHFPLLVRFRLGNPEHTTRYFATDEASLKTALQNVTMEDTICIKAGEIALSEQIAPQCSFTMIGGFNDDFSQIVGTTKFTANGINKSAIYIPHYYTLCLENVEIQGGSVSSLAEGGAIYSNGANLKLKNCIFSGNTSESKGGAIMVTVDSLRVNDCIFTQNKAKTGAALFAQVRTHVAVKCSQFISNEAADGGAGIMTTEFYTFSVQNCSFSNNNSGKYGALYICPSEKALSANLLNNCFLNNTLYAKSGLASVVKFYGGAAVNVKMNNVNQLFNMAHCTILGNNSEFSGTSNFTGAAVNVFQGKACIMNNIILGNSLKMGDGSMSWADLNSSSDANVWRNTYTLTSASEDIAGWENSITKSFGGKLENGIYEAVVYKNGAHPFLQKTLADYNLACLPTTQRLCESAFSYDLDENGVLNGYVSRDMLGNQRIMKSCIGALEFTGTDTAVEDLTDSDSSKHGEPIAIYTITGHRLPMNVSLPQGIYIMTDGVNTWKTFIK